MKIHREFCPIYLSSIGRYNSTYYPVCNCDGFTQTDGSSSNIKPNVVDKNSANLVPCLAPSHNWKLVCDTSGAMFACEICGLNKIKASEPCVRG